MGKDPRADRTAVIEDPQQEIRRQIAQTREELGDTVASVARKADVKTQARYKIYETKSSVTRKRGELLGKARHASPKTVTTAASSCSQALRENPVITAALAAFAIGLLIGRSRAR
jgi:ElaB/YqjD/DUF883 family membrane-anchored ribosome-binding protein